jgi:hypothetical protein
MYILSVKGRPVACYPCSSVGYSSARAGGTPAHPGAGYAGETPALPGGAWFNHAAQRYNPVFALAVGLMKIEK